MEGLVVVVGGGGTNRAWQGLAGRMRRGRPAAQHSPPAGGLCVCACMRAACALHARSRIAPTLHGPASRSAPAVYTYAHARASPGESAVAVCRPRLPLSGVRRASAGVGSSGGGSAGESARQS